jgi:hypothetical protein
MAFGAIEINRSLQNSGDEASSTDVMLDVLDKHFKVAGVEISERLRIADFNVLPGVTSDEGEGDDWPELRKRIHSRDILVFGGRVWMGHRTSRRHPGRWRRPPGWSAAQLAGLLKAKPYPG